MKARTEKDLKQRTKEEKPRRSRGGKVIVKEGDAQWIYRSVYLKEGAHYKVSGEFAARGVETSQVSMAVATEPKNESAVVRLVENREVGKTWKRVSGYFTAPTEGRYYVGWLIGGWKECAMDEMGVSEVQCVPPMASKVSKIRSKSAIIAWTAEMGDSWELKVSDKEDLTNVVYDKPAAVKSAFVDGLTPDTKYYYAVRSVCGGVPSDWTEMSTFVTRCDVAGMPLREDFEDENLSEFKCWTVTGSGVEYSRSTEQKHSGAASLALKNGMIVSPELKVTSLAGYMITGWVRAEADNAVVGVGVMSEPDDISTAIGTSEVKIEKGGVWQEFVGYFVLPDDAEQDASTQKYVTLSVSGESGFYFDDLRIESLPPCPQPIEPTISGVTHNAFTLGWKTVGAETKWMVTVCSTDGHHELDAVVDENPSVVEGLRPTKEYDVSIKAICGVNDTSEVVYCGRLVTECGPYSLPYDMYIDAADGQALPQCWSLGEGNTDAASDYNWKAYNGSTGESCLRYNADMYQTLLSPEVDLTGESSIAMSATVVNSAAAGEMIVRVSTDGGKTFGELGRVQPSDARQVLRYDLTPYAGSKAIIALEAHGGKSSDSHTDIYSFTIEREETCSRPDTIKLVEVGDKEIALTLVDRVEGHNAWQAVCGTKGFDYRNAEPQDVTAKKFAMNGLLPLTDYYVYVRTKCSASEFSAWRGPLKVTTACPDEIQLPYTESFEYNTIDDLCIDVLNHKSEGNLPSMRLQSGSAPSDGEKCLGLNGGTSTPLYMVFPTTNVPLENVKVKFDYKTPAGSDKDNFQLDLGVLTDVNDLSTFVSLKQCYRTYREYETVEFDFNTQEQVFAANARIAIKLLPVSSNMGMEIMYFDNVRITENVPCAEITRFDILNVKDDVVTATADFRTDSILCVWGAAGTAADDCTDSKIIKTKEFTIEGLERGKSYYMYVRTMCADESIKLWSAPRLVSVSCDVIPLAEGERWVENFDGYDYDMLFPQCFSTLLAEEVDGALYPALDTEYAAKGRGIRFRSENTIALPLFDADADRLTLSFSYRGKHGFVYVALRDHLYSGSQTRIGEGLAPDPDDEDKLQRVTFDLSSYETKGKYIVIYTGEENSDMTIDSLVVERSAACFAPRNLNVMVGDTLLSTSWQKVPDAVGYEYRLVSADETVTNTLTTPSLLLTSLRPSTHYDLSIRTVCSEGDATDWTEYGFTTLANVTPLPFSTGFEDETDNAKWQYRQNSSGNRFVIGDDGAAAHDGSSALYISSDGTSYAYDVLREAKGQHIYRSFFLESGRYSCTYDWRCIGEDDSDRGGEIDYATVYLVHASEPVTAETMIIPNPAVVTVLHNDRNSLSDQSSWTQTDKEFDIHTPGYYNIVISWYNDDKRGAQPPLSIDNLTLDRIDCLPLASVSVDAVTARSAYLSVVNPNVDGFIEYRLLHDNQVLATDTVADGSISFVDFLAPSTEYLFSARPYCGEGMAMPYVDVNFTTAPLDAPTGLRLDAVGLDAATLSWSGSYLRYNVRILSGDIVVNDTVVSAPALSVHGLTPSSAYTARVRSEEDGFYSEWTDLSFCTGCGDTYAPYHEDFSYTSSTAVPCCWDIHSGSDIGDGKANWHVADGMLRLSTSQSEGHAEIWSPAITITDAATRLTFDYINTSPFDTLRVRVSTDGGASFGDPLLEAAVTSTMTSAEYSLGDYVDETIIIAFSVNATRQLQTNYVAVDRFRVACLSSPVTVVDSVCPGYAYEKNGFSIPVDLISESGDYNITQLIAATSKGQCDYYGTLRLHVRHGGTHHVSATICEGDVYTSQAFPKGISVAGEYRNTILSTDGCDSTVILHLSVGNPTLEVLDTVCEADLPYTFAGKEYYHGGTFSDTVRLTSRCDSVTILRLTVLPTRFETTARVCSGGSFTWHDYFGRDTILTSSGQYVHRYRNHRGCDSIEVLDFTVLPDYVRLDSTICHGQSVLHGTTLYTTTGVYPVTLENELRCPYTSELHLTVTPPDTTTFDDISCQGNDYFGHGFLDIPVRSDTVLLRNERDADDCISVTRVNVDYIPTIEIYDTVHILPGGSYTFCGNSYNEPGTFSCITPSADGCDSITHLTIVVTTGTDHASILPLTLAPNPVGIDDITYIHRTWTAEEQRGLTVEIISSVGQHLTTYTPLYYPIAIRSLHTSGVYYIRVTTGTGDVYMGRLIVR